MRRRSQLDELLPRYHFHELHRRVVEAPPGRVYDAVKAVTLGEMPLVRLLFAIRSLPAVLARKGGLPRAGAEPLFGQMSRSGFTVLADDHGREIVVGVVGQMWELRGGEAARIRDGAEFVAFDRPGFAKAAMNFLLLEWKGRTCLGTETRILVTDEASRGKFARYWLLIRPGSGAIRRIWLGAIARRAERAA